MADLREECGVFGVYNLDKESDCAPDVYFGLMALQHRGQESCGIAVNKNREISSHKDAGLVDEVFSPKILSELHGNMGIGHVRYSTTGGGGVCNAQPLIINYAKGTLAIAHNGSIVNAEILQEEFTKIGAIFQTTSDTEIIAYAIARERLDAGSIEMAINRAMKRLRGAYSLLVMSPKKLIAVRDPWGIRPLCIGRTGDKIVFSSETCGLDAVDAEYVREVEAGEIVIVENGEMRSVKENCTGVENICIFEYIYFARPDSVICNQLVYDARKRAGALLAKQHKVEADVVIGVPDSGVPAAIGYSKQSGIPYDIGMVKNRYVGRTFIKPEQFQRETSVKIKLNTLGNSLKGKRVVLVDDSIVRGTTCARIIQLLRDSGASEIHLRVSSPPFLWRCYFGTDIGTREELVAYKYSQKEICEMVGADSLGYLDGDSLKEIIPSADCGFCEACFSGNYPMDSEKLRGE